MKFNDPFVLAGYQGPEYFCDRVAKVRRLALRGNTQQGQSHARGGSGYVVFGRLLAACLSIKK